MTHKTTDSGYCQQVAEAAALGAVIELDPDMLDDFGAPDPNTYTPPFSLEEAMDARFGDVAP